MSPGSGAWDKSHNRILLAKASRTTRFGNGAEKVRKCMHRMRSACNPSVDKDHHSEILQDGCINPYTHLSCIVCDLFVIHHSKILQDDCINPDTHPSCMHRMRPLYNQSVPMWRAKIARFQAPYLTTQKSIREYLHLGNFCTITLNHWFVELERANLPKRKYSRMLLFFVK